MNRYYVYTYWRLDTNEPFYVGKGSGRRWKDLWSRKGHFKNIINKIPIAVVIEKDNLTESEAFYWEEKTIEELVFEYGFSIDISNNDDDTHYCHLVNQTWGGEGASGAVAWNKGKINVFSDETKKKMSEAKKGKYCGENHPMYGKRGEESPVSKKVICLTTGRKFNTVKEGSLFYRCNECSTTRCCKNQLKMSGKLNGEPLVWMYLEDYEKADREQVLLKVSWSKEKREYRGKNSSCAKSVICLTTKRIFYTAKEASEYYNCGSHIPGCCRGERNYSGKLPDGTKLRWRYLTWKHNKIFRVK